MNIAIIFYNIGSYHIARIQAFYEICQTLSWHVTAIQIIDSTQEHPWGEIKKTPFSIETLLSRDENLSSLELSFNSTVAAQKLPTLLTALQPDILVIPGWGFPVSRCALQWAKKHQKRAILMSESKEDDEIRQWWKEWIKSFLYVQRFDAAIVGNDLHQNYLIRLGISKDKIFQGYDIVDNQYFTEQAAIARQNPEKARERQSKIPNKPYFIAVTRFIPRKNLLRLIESFAAYHQQVNADNAWDLVICGSGIEENAIRTMIDQLNLQNSVHLPGFLTYQQMGDWYGCAGAFIHPALVEQWGLVVNEACASGLPILCSQTVGAAYSLVKHAENGFIFNPQNTAEMTNSLMEMHRLSPSERRKMGQCSQTIVAEFSPKKFGEGLISAINSTLSS